MFSWVFPDLPSFDWSLVLTLPFTCFLTCLAILCFIFMAIFPNMFQPPGCMWLLLSTSLSGRCAFSINDEHDDDNDGGRASCPALSPALYLLSVPTTPTERLKNSWMPQPNVTFTLGNMWHCWQFLPSSQICSPWLPWVSSWSSSRPSPLVNSVTSWAYSCEGVLITSW